ncbi:MAG: hypothetical protein Q4G70_00455 [Pseudomonadota bacterium]|nr:hypothetical protein [Pseudomonadota bacterium]
MRWFQIDDPRFAVFPPWMRAFGVSKQDGVIYLPASIAGPEEIVVPKGSLAGVQFATRHEHAFLPADWMATAFPEVSEVCRKLVAMAEQVRPTDSQCVARYLELVAQADEIDDFRISRTMDDENYSRQQITDATWFIPIALGRRALRNKGLGFAKMYRVFSPDGEVVNQGAFLDNGVYMQASELQSPLLTEPVVKKLALRSPEVLGYREAMSSGAKAADFQTVPVVFFTGTPTEAGLRRANQYAEKWAVARGEQC